LLPHVRQGTTLPLMLLLYTMLNSRGSDAPQAGPSRAITNNTKAPATHILRVMSDPPKN
jgi:hypothetical protein